MAKKKKNKIGVMYSTNSNFVYEYEKEDETPAIENQLLEVWIDKHRAGKTAVIIKGFIGNNDDLKSLSKMLKTKCGVGGSTKKGEIIIQGDLRDKIMDILKDQGYKFKRVGG